MWPSLLLALLALAPAPQPAASAPHLRQARNEVTSFSPKVISSAQDTSLQLTGLGSIGSCKRVPSLCECIFADKWPNPAAKKSSPLTLDANGIATCVLTAAMKTDLIAGRRFEPPALTVQAKLNVQYSRTSTTQGDCDDCYLSFHFFNPALSVVTAVSEALQGATSLARGPVDSVSTLTITGSGFVSSPNANCLTTLNGAIVAQHPATFVSSTEYSCRMQAYAASSHGQDTTLQLHFSMTGALSDTVTVAAGLTPLTYAYVAAAPRMAAVAAVQGGTGIEVEWSTGIALRPACTVGLMLDVRENAEYDSDTSVRCAVHIPGSDLAASKAALLAMVADTAASIVVFSNTAGHATDAVSALTALGFSAATSRGSLASESIAINELCASCARSMYLADWTVAEIIKYQEATLTTPSLIRVGSVACDSVWDDATAAAFGSAATCEWLDYQRMLITLDTSGGATNLRGMQLVPKSGVIIQATSAMPYAAFSATAAGTLAAYQAQTLDLEGPSSFPLCAGTGNSPGAILSASINGVVEASPLTVTWAVDGVAQVADGTGPAAQLDLQYLGLIVGPHTIVASVKDAAGAELVGTTTTVTVTSDETKSVAYFAGGGTLSLRRQDTAAVRAVLSPGCASSVAAAAEFKVVLSKVIRNTATVQSETSGLEYLITAKSLPRGNYRVDLYQSGGAAIATQNIVVRSSALTARVVGGTARSLQQKIATTLRAAKPDPDFDGDELSYTYTWTCPDCGTDFGGDTTGKDTSTLSGLRLQAIGAYTVHLEITASDGRSAQTSTRLNVVSNADHGVDGHAIAVHPSASTLPAGVGAKAVLDGVLSESAVNPAGQRFGRLAWVAVPGDRATPGATAALDLAANARSIATTYAISAPEIADQLTQLKSAVVTLVLDSAGMQPGKQYMFALESTSTDTLNTVIQSSARATVTVAYPPGNFLSPGARLGAAPATGGSLTQAFAIKASGYVVDATRMPLTYTFAIREAGRMTPVVIGQSHSDRLPSAILPSTARFIGVKVADCDGSSTEWEWSAISVSATTFGTAAFDAILSDGTFAPVAHFLPENIQRLQMVALHIAASASASASSGTQLRALESTLSQLHAVAVLVAATSSSPSRAQRLAQISSFMFYLSGLVAELSITPTGSSLIGDIQALAAGALDDVYAEPYAELAIAAAGTFDNLVTPADLRAVSSGQDNAFLAPLSSTIGSVQGRLCASLDYNQRPVTVNTSLVTFNYHRSPVTAASTPGVQVGIAAATTSELRRSAAACIQGLRKGARPVSCNGGCLALAEISGDVQSAVGPQVLAPGNADFPIPATLNAGFARVLVVANSGAAYADSDSSVLFKGVANCSTSSGVCWECREWSPVAKNWVTSPSSSADAAAGSVVCSTGASSSSVGVFKPCPAGFVGRNCESKCPMGLYGYACASVNNCSNHGLNDHVTGACDCDTGYTGETCEMECSSEAARAVYTPSAAAASLFAQGHGANCATQCNCAAEGSAQCNRVTGACTCKVGYNGTGCTNNIDNCASVPCQHSSQCTDLVNDYTCNCTGTGFYGRNCELLVDECAVNSCENNASCVDGLQSFTCACPVGLTGAFCESYCPDGKYGAGCASTCKCGSRGVCHAVTGTCDCSPGWSGEDCASHDEDKTWIIVVGVVIPVLVIALLIGLYFYLTAGKKKTFPINREAFAGHQQAPAPAPAQEPAPALVNDPFLLLRNDLDGMLGGMAAPKPAAKILPELRTDSGKGTRASASSTDAPANPGGAADGGETIQKKASQTSTTSGPDRKESQSGRAKLEYSVIKYEGSNKEELATKLHISRTDDTTLAVLRERLRARYEALAQKGTVFYFRKANSSDRHLVSHEPTLFVKNTYAASDVDPAAAAAAPKGNIDVEVIKYEGDSVRADFCVCGNVNQFICSNCSVQGYCSPVCQKSNWKEHKSECKEVQARKAAELKTAPATASTHSPDPSQGAASTSGEAAAAGSDAKCGSVTCTNEPIFDCSQCGNVGYCCRKCQKDDWKRHKKECAKAKAAEAKTAAPAAESAPEAPKPAQAEPTVANASEAPKKPESLASKEPAPQPPQEPTFVALTEPEPAAGDVQPATSSEA